ncbi:MAG: diguanylate cyclase [Pseudomonadota bacterium]
MTDRILVVDAVSANRIVLKVKLAAAGYEVEQAVTLREAPSRAAQSEPDALVVSLPDAQPPTLSALTSMRKRISKPDLPCLVVLPHFDAADRRKALRAGADDVLRKPVEDEALIGKIRRLLHGRSLSLQDQIHDLVREPGHPATPRSTVRTDRGVAVVAGSKTLRAEWARHFQNSELFPVDPLGTTDVLDRGTAYAAYVIQADQQRRDDGLNLLCELKARHAPASVTSLVILPEGDHQRAALARELGASDVVFEPVQAAEMVQRVSALVQRQQETTALRRSAEEGLRLAMTDPLTGLSNRRHAMQVLPRMMQSSQGAVALMMLDLDHFKAINDRFGHSAGDQVLTEFAETLRSALHESALVARYGGEEFLVALPKTGGRVAMEEADMLRRATQRIAGLLQLPGAQISASIGLALHSIGETAQSLIARADTALYQAKGSGRDRVILAPPVSRPATSLLA